MKTFYAISKITTESKRKVIFLSFLIENYMVGKPY